MKWLDRLLGKRPVPDHIQAALDASAAAKVVTTKATAAVDDYWSARRSSLEDQMRLRGVDATIPRPPRRPAH